MVVHRLALLLVPRRRCAIHEGRRRGAAVRLSQLAAEPRVRECGRGRQAVPRGRLRRRMARGVDGGLPEPHRLDHRHSHAAVPRRHAVDAVLARPDVLVGDRGEPHRQLATGRQVPRLAGRAAARAPAQGAARQAGARRPRRRRRSLAVAKGPSRRRRSAPLRRSDARRRNASAVRRDGQARKAGAGESAAAAARSRAAAAAPRRRVHGPAAVAARCAEGRAEDRRARADGRRAAARREMPRVRRRRRGRADSSGPGRHDLRVQAGRRREVRKDHRPGRRSVPGDAGRVGADRSHSRQVDRRHPDPEPHPRADLAARAAAVGDVPALGVEADARAREDHPRRALHDRSRRRCRTC